MEIKKGGENIFEFNKFVVFYFYQNDYIKFWSNSVTYIVINPK